MKRNSNLAGYHLHQASALLFRIAGKEAAEASPGLIWEWEDAMNMMNAAAEALGYTLVKNAEPVALAPVFGAADLGMKPASPEPMTAEACNV